MAYPDHEVVGEEAGTSGPPGRYRWLIDPIDGTKAFVTGSPLWGTLLGLLDDGTPGRRAGSTSRTSRRRSSASPDAARGWTGAARVSELRTRRGVTLDDAVVYCTTPTMFADPGERALFDAVRRRARLVRYGGDCYAYAQLAMGHVDVVIDTGLQPYDIVAPMAVIEAAGGVVRGATAAGTGEPDGGFALAAGSAGVGGGRSRELGRGRSALDGAGRDAADDEALEELEQQDDRDRGDQRAGGERPPPQVVAVAGEEPLQTGGHRLRRRRDVLAEQDHGGDEELGLGGDEREQEDDRQHRASPAGG